LYLNRVLLPGEVGVRLRCLVNRKAFKVSLTLRSAVDLATRVRRHLTSIQNLVRGLRRLRERLGVNVVRCFVLADLVLPNVSIA
jgi:hypothetical protein